MTFMHNKKQGEISAGKHMLMLVLLLGMAACSTTSSNSVIKKKPSIVNAEPDKKAMVHTQLARGYMEQKQYATAKNQLERALEISPSHSDSNYVMALLMMRLEQYSTAEKHFERAVTSDRDNSSAAHDFGTFLCQINKPTKAVKYFDIAASNPLFAQAKLSYARAGQCIAKTDAKRAEDYLQKALSLDKRLRPALYTLAQLKFEDGNHLSARAYIERYLAITVPQPESLMLAYKIESNLNANEQANTYRSKLLNTFPGSKQARELRGSDRF